MYIFPKRNFTLSLKQEGTGKTAQVAIEQKELQAEQVFNGPEDKNIHISYKGKEEVRIPIKSILLASESNYRLIPIEISEVVPPAKKEEAIELEKCEVVPARERQANDLIIVAKENPYYEPRQITIKLRQTGEYALDEEMVLTVTQEEKPDDGIFAVKPEKLTADWNGGQKSASVTSTSKGKTVGWSVSNKANLPDWVTLSGEGTGTLSVTAKPNFGR